MNNYLTNALSRYRLMPEFLGMDIVKLDTVGRFGNTPLHIAAMQGDLGMVDLLVKEGASLDARGEDGLTPLEAALELGMTEVAEYLGGRGDR